MTCANSRPRFRIRGIDSLAHRADVVLDLQGLVERLNLTIDGLQQLARRCASSVDLLSQPAAAADAKR
jgi:hypothetical protein